MDRFSMAMGITFLNRAAFFVMTLAQVAEESKSITWSTWTTTKEGGMGCLPKNKKYEEKWDKEACLDIL
jgi:hypothetical protein